MDLNFTWFDKSLIALAGAFVTGVCFYGTLVVFDMYSPLIGQSVSYSMAVNGKPEVCAEDPAEMIFDGKICGVSGSTVTVFWHALANTSPGSNCGGAEVFGILWPAPGLFPRNAELFRIQ